MREFLQEIIDSLKGKEKDYTTGSIKRAMVLLAIPMVIEMMWESLFSIVDIYFVSSLGISEAVAIVGITESLMTIVYAFGIGFAMATTALVARRIGEKNFELASLSSMQAIFIVLLISLPITIAGIFFTDKILELMNTSQSAIALGSSYTRLMLIGNVSIMLLFVINAIFRSAGDANIAMWILIFANSINILLDPCLIKGIGPFPELGIYGAAVATNIGRGLAVLVQIYILIKGTGKIKIMLSALKVNLGIIWQLIKLSGGTIGQFIIATSSWIILVSFATKFGDEVVAGYTIAIRIIMFAILPAWGLSNAASTLVGQNLGAQQPDRAEKSVWLTLKANVAFLLAIAIVFIIVPRPFVEFFTSDPDVLYNGINGLRIISFGFVFYGIGMVLSQSFNGAGDTYTPTWINFICFWIIELPLAYLLSHHTGLAEKGVYYSIPIAESILGILLLLLFRKGKWKTVKV